MSEQDGPYKPYDSAFKTLAHDCPQLLIPVVNEVFGMTFSPRELVVQMDPDQLVPTADGGVETREVDSLFTVGRDQRATFHVECQSTPDNTMVVRFWRYDSHIATMTAEMIEDGVMEVTFPRSAVLYLRHNSNTPDALKLKMKKHGGETVDLYEIPIIKMQRYTLDELFEKDLYFLLPFYPFAHETRLPEYEADEHKLDDLLREIEEIDKRLEEAVTSGRIDDFERRAILMMMQVVMRGLTKRQTNVMKGVDRTMGGVILDYEAKRILNRGRAEGRDEGRAEGMAKGRAEGEAKGKMELLFDLVGRGLLSDKDASSSIEMPIADFKQRMSEYNRAHA